jgi:hypothetical protein
MSVESLTDLKLATERKLKGSVYNQGGEAIDTEFFEHLLRRLQVFEAKAFLRQFHYKLLKTRLDQLNSFNEQEMAEARRLLDENSKQLTQISHVNPVLGDDVPALEASDENVDDDTWEEIDDEELSGELASIGAKAAAVCYSPLLLTDTQLESEDLTRWELVDEEDDWQQLQTDREAVLQAVMRRMEERGELEPSSASSSEYSASSYLPSTTSARARQPHGMDEDGDDMRSSLSSSASSAAASAAGSGLGFNKLPTTNLLSRLPAPSFAGRKIDEQLWKDEVSKGLTEGESSFAVWKFKR